MLTYCNQHLDARLAGHDRRVLATRGWHEVHPPPSPPTTQMTICHRPRSMFRRNVARRRPRGSGTQLLLCGDRSHGRLRPPARPHLLSQPAASSLAQYLCASDTHFCALCVAVVREPHTARKIADAGLAHLMGTGDHGGVAGGPSPSPGGLLATLALEAANEWLPPRQNSDPENEPLEEFVSPLLKISLTWKSLKYTL